MKALNIVVAMLLASYLTTATGMEEAIDKGEHNYAGGTCTWERVDSKRHIKMTSQDLSGQIEIVSELSGIGGPYRWHVLPGPGVQRGVQGTARTGRSALDSLCGAMIAAHVRAQQEAAYDPHAAYDELLEALQGKP